MSFDTEHRALVAELTRLNQKFSAFLNGGPDQTVQTESGFVKTISGIEKALERFNYVQRVIDVPTKNELDMSWGAYEDGMLFRVFRDLTSTNNGLWQKQFDPEQEVFSLVKVTYSDLYDLRDINPAPWNYLNFSFTKQDFDNLNTTIVQRSIPMSTSGHSETIRIEIEFKSMKKGFRGVKKVVHDYAFVLGDVDAVIATVDNISSTLNVALEQNFSTLGFPTIEMENNVVGEGVIDFRLFLSHSLIEQDMVVNVKVIGPNGKTKA